MENNSASMLSQSVINLALDALEFEADSAERGMETPVAGELAESTAQKFLAARDRDGSARR